jgi:hypothetical protein
MLLKVSHERDYESDILRHQSYSECMLPLILVHLRHLLVSDIFFDACWKEISEACLLAPFEYRSMQLL